MDGYKKYHHALLHKLRAAGEQLECLRSYIGALPISGDLGMPEVKDIMFKVNLYFDSFLFFAGSALDILARELLTYYGLPVPHRVYYSTARQDIEAARPRESILGALADPRWLPEFRNYRNAATHEIIIVPECRICYGEGGTAARVLLPLPNDPRNPVNASAHPRNPDGVRYATKNFKRVLSQINRIYTQVDRRARSTQRLPV